MSLILCENWSGSEETISLAAAYVEYAQAKRYTRVSWLASSDWDTWLLGMSIINQAFHMGCHLFGSYDRGQIKDHGMRQRFEGYPPIPRKTLYI